MGWKKVQSGDYFEKENALIEHRGRLDGRIKELVEKKTEVFIKTIFSEAKSSKFQQVWNRELGREGGVTIARSVVVFYMFAFNFLSFDCRR